MRWHFNRALNGASGFHIRKGFPGRGLSMSKGVLEGAGFRVDLWIRVDPYR